MFARRFALGIGPAVAVVAAAGLVGEPAGANGAAGCSGTGGTVVFVDFNQLLAGEDLRKGCAAGASNAAEAFRQAGFELAYSAAPGMNGYVCTVNEMPADRDCTGGDAYWSLWWADGKGGPWKYSSLGVDSLDAPPGGYVAFSWHEGSGTSGTKPDVAPTPRVATSTPTPSPTRGGGSTGGGSTGGGSTGGKDDKGGEEDTSTDPSSSATPSQSPSASTTPSGSPSSSAGGTTSPTEASSSTVPGAEEITAGPETDDVAHTDDESGPFPTWAMVGLGVGVLGAAGAVPLIRRRLG